MCQSALAYRSAFSCKDMPGWLILMTEFRIHCSLLHEGVLLADFNRTVSAISTTVKDRGYVGLPLHYHYQ